MDYGTAETGEKFHNHFLTLDRRIIMLSAVFRFRLQPYGLLVKVRCRDSTW